MADWTTLRLQTKGYREAIRALLERDGARADRIPAGWRNNLRWHLGHLIVTPHLLTEGLAGEPLSLPEEYRRWFAKGTSPSDWDSSATPSFEDLLPMLVSGVDRLFDHFEEGRDSSFPRPYPTSLGLSLGTPAEGLLYSFGHDGLHMGMMRALIRALDAHPPDPAS